MSVGLGTFDEGRLSAYNELQEVVPNMKSWLLLLFFLLRIDNLLVSVRDDLGTALLLSSLAVVLL